ncbi:hypothetical protein Rsub_10103 [Raphidocelis subcapitata]|uniref:Dynein light chain n=1 Tax=Raphidocelis subcapitata TaxID=307507 RepID=A0A2V0PDP6_9CHLO|nr:hypothetical protein Rsub_10103 [Raphidocelis subcapitata]|eukprot:GBF97092.1 hypothetical protein Rsub_10103 [Raphidocelis subcapitata]
MTVETAQQQPAASTGPAAAGPPPADPRDALAAREPHALRVVASVLPEQLQRDAILVATAARLNPTAAPPAEAGRSKGPDGAWHAAVGKSFACAVSHEARAYIHLRVDALHVVIWRSRDSPFHAND